MSQAGITTRTGLKWSAGRSTSRVSSLLVVGLLIFAAGWLRFGFVQLYDCFKDWVGHCEYP
jgi:hypothetical protein